MADRITEIVPGVYDLTITERNGGRYRVFLVDGETPTLVDAAFADTVDTVTDRINALGIAPERLVVTHGDPDHVGGLAGLAERFDLETWVPAVTDLDGEYDPDERYDDGAEIGPFTAVHTPGHTPGHHALIAEERGFAVLGDAVFGSDARGLPAGYFVLPTATFSADLAAADEALERLTDSSFDAGLVFHGSSVTEGASEKLGAFVDFAGKP